MEEELRRPASSCDGIHHIYIFKAPQRALSLSTPLLAVSLSPCPVTRPKRLFFSLEQTTLPKEMTLSMGQVPTRAPVFS